MDAARRVRSTALGLLVCLAAIPMTTPSSNTQDGTRRQPSSNSRSSSAMVGTVLGDALPEAPRMIHVARVRELMNEEIAHDRGPLKQQTAVEADRTARRAASPARALPPDDTLSGTEAELAGTLSQRAPEYLARVRDEPASQGIAQGAARWMRRRHRVSRPAADLQRAAGPDLPARCTRQLSAQPASAILAGRETAREPGLGGALRRACARSSARCRSTKCSTARPRGPGGHDDLHPPRSKHAHRQPTRAPALAHDPRLLGVLVGPQGQLRCVELPAFRDGTSDQPAT